MDATVDNFPKPCRENINTITTAFRTDAETAYAMMLMTATLMDLCPADPKVAEIILDDCKGRQAVRKS